MARDTFFGRNMVGQDPWARRGEATTAAASAVSAALPVGVITAYYGATAPAGWLLCDGAAIPAQYTALIALVGANTPNLKGRVLVGLDAAQTEFDVLGETGGAKTVALTTAELATHLHTVPDHTHNAYIVDTNGSVPGGSGNRFFLASGGGANGSLVGGGATGLNSGNNGSGTAHNNLPPYMAISYIIKAQ